MSGKKLFSISIGQLHPGGCKKGINLAGCDKPGTFAACAHFGEVSSSTMIVAGEVGGARDSAVALMKTIRVYNPRTGLSRE